MRSATPERDFAKRARPAPAPPPLPSSRRAIFIDVENSSKPEHLSRVLDHLDIDRHNQRVELIAVGNWRVIGADSARLLARRGAQLVHSAPATGVRDWSDLRIAVSAGVWLGVARPGDQIEVVSDDRAFDAVGDVAAVLGVTFRRLSYRGLAGVTPAEAPIPQETGAAPREGRSRRGRGRHRGRGRPRFESGGAHPPAREHAAHAPRAAEPRPAPDSGAHTAPHDEIVEVVRELAQRAPNGAVLIDTLARTLKERGFSRPPGSPRLITRLRRIRELAVSRTGMITLVGAAGAASGTDSEPAPTSGDVIDADVTPAPAMDDGGEGSDGDDGPEPGNEALPTNGAPGAGTPHRSRRRRGRRRRRGGRGGGGGGGSAAPAAAPA
ncbi:MAG TPA: hypothetical protein VFE48_22995 [Methylomirabilota bacterium]|nr:hypothetical protein [Methylomirabilota bacterium]